MIGESYDDAVKGMIDEIVAWMDMRRLNPKRLFLCWSYAKSGIISLTYLVGNV